MFSFDPIKTITCIDGGALVVKSEEEAQILYEMRLIGMTQRLDALYRNQRSYSYDVERMGFRYHMANSHASIGLSQLAKLEIIKSTRQQACAYYSQQFANMPEIINPQINFNDIVPFLYYIRVEKSKRKALRDYLAERNIDTGFHWQPGHWFTLFKDAKRGDLTVTEQVAEELISLPLYAKIDKRDQDSVIQSIKNFFS